MESTASLLQNTWIKRHAGWAIAISVVLLIATFIAAVFLLVETIFHNSEVFHLAVSTAEANPATIQALGAPTGTGLFVSGNIEVSNAAGNAELSIPISGSNGHGTIYVEARKSDGNWHMNVLQFFADGNRTPIDLLSAAPSPESPK